MASRAHALKPPVAAVGAPVLEASPVDLHTLARLALPGATPVSTFKLLPPPYHEPQSRPSAQHDRKRKEHPGGESDNGTDSDTETSKRRAVNRVAAANCRKRKHDRETGLRERLRQLHASNDLLVAAYHNVHHALVTAEAAFIAHHASGCPVVPK